MDRNLPPQASPRHRTFSLTALGLSLVLGASWTAVASAHPGHGPHHEAQTWAHYVTSPYHLAVAALVALALMIAIPIVWRSRLVRAWRGGEPVRATVPVRERG